MGYMKDPKKEKHGSNHQTRFDWEGFWLSFGMGIGFLLLSAFLFWVKFSGIPKERSTPQSYLSSQHMARFLPDSVKEWIFLALAGGFGIFGIFLIGVGVVWIFLKGQ